MCLRCYYCTARKVMPSGEAYSSTLLPSAVSYAASRLWGKKPWTVVISSGERYGSSGARLGGAGIFYVSRKEAGMGYSGAMTRIVKEEIVSRNPKVVSGALVFAGTRVPVKNLVDYLKAGHPLDEFLDDFPTVTREQAVAYLEMSPEATDALLEREASAG